jgi:type 2 lantibiotic biosynthesis protein LanM
MSHISLDSPAWYGALTLNERLTTCLDRTAAVGSEAGRGCNAAKAARRLQRWRSLPALAHDDLLAQRLASAGLTDAVFLQILGESIEAAHNRVVGAGRPRPAWLMQIETALATKPDAMPADSSGPDEAPSPEPDQPASLLDVFAPFVRQGAARLQVGIEALAGRYADAPFNPDTVLSLLFSTLPPQLFDIVGRTMALEINVARLHGLLDGDTPEARFHSFLRRLAQPEHLAALLEEYPVMARAVVSCIDRWVDCSLEFLGHLSADRAAIAETFTPAGALGHVDRLQGGAGDRHRGGRAVLIAGFSSGLQLVYKPRPMALDRRFQDLLVWLNAHGAPQPFRTLQILDRGAYGWAECVTPAACDTLAAVRRFYVRQGGQLALLYALAATDFHFENLMAAGEQPMLLDLEALMQPVLQDQTALGGSAPMLAVQALHNSVIAVGLLPQRLWANRESAGIDISGLGGAGGQLTRRIPMVGGYNRPTLEGVEVQAFDYTDALVEGFRCVYRLLMAHRAELLAPGGPLERFADDEIRVVLRPTQTYAALLHDSYHPDMLRDALDRDQLLDRLWGPVPYQPQLATVIPSEQRDLQSGDIPIFMTRVRSRDLHSTTAVIPEFFAESGLDHVRRRVAGLSEADMERQTWFIRASLATLAGSTVGAKARADVDDLGCDDIATPSPTDSTPIVASVGRPRCSAQPARSSALRREACLAAARAVGDRLAVLAIRGSQDVAWIGLKLENERDWSLAPTAMDFYDGLPGVAFFLGYLSVVDPAGGHADLAAAALTTVLHGTEEMGDYCRSIGAFAGWGGSVYALTHLGIVLDRPDLVHRAEALVEQITPLIDQDEALDVIGGAAGAIGSLAALHHIAPSARTLETIRRCGERLLVRAQPMPTGIGWPSQGTSALLGFSHGAAGIAWALFEAASLTGELRFREVALDGLTYERSHFAPEHGNWPDLRAFNAPTTPRLTAAVRHGSGEDPSMPPVTVQASFMHAWCHGAPGIGLGRLRLLRHLDDPMIRAEIDAAIQSTLAAGFGANHSLCHGDLGNLDLLLEAARTLDPERWSDPFERVATAVLNSIAHRGPRCGNPLGVASPGFMTGLAGIGYQLLRLAEPARVPSVLTLSPPVT